MFKFLRQIVDTTQFLFNVTRFSCGIFNKIRVIPKFVLLYPVYFSLFVLVWKSSIRLVRHDTRRKIGLRNRCRATTRANPLIRRVNRENVAVARARESLLKRRDRESDDDCSIVIIERNARWNWSLTKIVRSWPRQVLASLPFKGLATVVAVVGLPVFNFHLIRLKRGEA